MASMDDDPFDPLAAAAAAAAAPLPRPRPASLRHNLLYKLRARETQWAPPGAGQAEMRKVYDNVVPNQTLFDVHVPNYDAVRKFSPDGQLLVCMGRSNGQVTVYEFQLPALVIGRSGDAKDAWPTYSVPSALAAATAAASPAPVPPTPPPPPPRDFANTDNVVPDGGAPEGGAPDREPPPQLAVVAALSACADRGFSAFFTPKFARTITHGNDLLSKDFCLFTDDSRFVRRGPPADARWARLRSGAHCRVRRVCSVPYLTQMILASSQPSALDAPRQPSSLNLFQMLEDITFWLVDLQTGEVRAGARLSELCRARRL